jgi:hypothetical protein
MLNMKAKEVMCRIVDALYKDGPYTVLDNGRYVYMDPGHIWKDPRFRNLDERHFYAEIERLDREHENKRGDIVNGCTANRKHFQERFGWSISTINRMDIDS